MSIIQIIYLISLLASLAVFCVYINKNRKSNPAFILLGIAVLLSTSGFYLLSGASSVETGLWAYKIMYTGSVFIMPFLIVIVGDLCNAKVSIPVKIFTLSVAFFFLIFVFLTKINGSGINNLFIYNTKVVDGVFDGDLGPLSYVYQITTIIYIVVIALMIIISYFRKDKIMDDKSFIILSSESILLLFLFILEAISVVHFSFIPAMSTVTLFTVSLFLGRNERFDPMSNSAYTEIVSKKYGYVIFDKQCRYVRSDSKAKEYFPEIEDWKKFAKVEIKKGYIYERVISQLPNISALDGIVLDDSAGHYYDLSAKEFSFGKKIVGYILLFYDRTNERKRYYDLAYSDQITKLKNRTAYMARLDHFEKFIEPAPSIVMMCDLNNLKFINDTMGHEKGDEALIRASELLTKHFKIIVSSTDRIVPYRIGGDEFAVLFCGSDEFIDFENRYKAFKSELSELGNAYDFPFYIATGYAVVGSKPVEEAIKIADGYMYADKKQYKEEHGIPMNHNAHINIDLKL